MTKNAGFLKRLFAFIVDLTLVVIITWLLYLFPSNMIIGKTIDKNYKQNVKEKYEAITSKYQGSTSIFGNGTDGIITILQKEHNDKLMTSDNFNSYKENGAKNYNSVKSAINSLSSFSSIEYNKETPYNETIQGKAHLIYTYLDGARTILNNNPMDETYKTFQSEKDAGNITTDKYNQLVEEYKNKIKEDYTKAFEVLLKYMMDYNEKNPESKVIESNIFGQLGANLKNYSNRTVKDIEVTFDGSEQNYIISLVDSYYQFETYLFDNVKAADSEKYTLDELTYLASYYGLTYKQAEETLPYYEKVNRHSTISVVYALLGFAVFYTVYTAAMCGQTLGRRLMKIKLVKDVADEDESVVTTVDEDGTEHQEKIVKPRKDNCGPLFAILHDVPFKFLYILLLGFLSVAFMGIAIILFTIIDGIMIRFTRSHRAIRDMLSRTIVIEKSF